MFMHLDGIPLEQNVEGVRQALRPPPIHLTVAAAVNTNTGKQRVRREESGSTEVKCREVGAGQKSVAAREV